MKKIKYFIFQGLSESGEDIVFPASISYSEANEEIAKAEAYKGEYTIEDDGETEFEAEPTQLDAIEAQVTYTAMMTDTLLEG